MSVDGVISHDLDMYLVRPRYVPSLNVSQDALSLLESSCRLLPGILVSVEVCRAYVGGVLSPTRIRNIFGIEAAMIVIDDSARPQMRTSAIRQV